MTRLDSKKFKERFGSWWKKIEPFFESGGLDGVYDELKAQSSKGIRIAPESVDTFRCFRETKLKDLKAVVCGLCPYHSEYQGVVVADGLALSCSKTQILQPSLEQWYGAIENEYYDGLCLSCYKPPDLLFLAHQGILLFNAALTTQVGKAAAHQELWAPFTRYIFEEIISLTGVPVMFLGKETWDFASFLGPEQPHFNLYHPSYNARNGTQWDSGGAFKKIESIILENNNEQIFWTLTDDLPF